MCCLFAILLAVIKRLNLKGDEMLLLEVSDDGVIQLWPAAVLPSEKYSDIRIREFEFEFETLLMRALEHASKLACVILRPDCRLRLFLDANILFLVGYSASSPVHDLLALAATGHCELLSFEYTFEEARRTWL